MDGDGRDEVGITRKSPENSRYFILDDAHRGFAPLPVDGGKKWGSDSYATSIAFGEVDGDGRAEIAIGRKSNSNQRVALLDDAQAGFRYLATAGKNWGSSNFSTSLAFGDSDGDGLDELAVGRFASGNNPRFLVYKFGHGELNSIHEGGNNWGSNNFATSIAFGNVDGDPMDELGIVRKSPENMRYQILDDYGHNFRNVHQGGHNWGSGNFATRIAFGDVDGDGKDEVGISRLSSTNDRYWILDDAQDYFSILDSGGRNWGDDNFSTCIAFGDMDGDGRDDYGITRKSDQNMRYAVYLLKQ